MRLVKLPSDPRRRPGTVGALLVLALGSCSAAVSVEERAAHAPRTPTFAADVAPLVHRSCTPCHHEGGSGPFPLASYEDVRRRAKQIALVTRTRFMPPWKPEPGFGQFLDERILSDEEIDLFARWAAADAPLGDAELVPPPPVFEERWLLGKPDLVLSMGEHYPVPAEGKDHYRSFVVPSHETEERWVRAFDFEPDNRRPVHHIITLFDTSGSARARDAATEGLGFEGMIALNELFGTEINGWGPGATPRMLPEGSAWRLPAGVDFVLDTHFQTTGKVEPVEISIGVYFTDERPSAPMTNLSLSAPILCIPPGKSDYTVDFRFELPVPVTAISIQPHAHYVGKSTQVVARLPDGSRMPLIRIPDWDFNWQDSYRFTEPIPLPASTVLEMHYVYDNSAANERNPFSPPHRILSGERSTDEMGLLYLQVAVRDEHAARLQEALLSHQHRVNELSWDLEKVFRGIIHGFDSDGDAMLDATEDARATEYVNALPGHPHAKVFDRDEDGELDEQERVFFESAIRLWNGGR